MYYNNNDSHSQGPGIVPSRPPVVRLDNEYVPDEAHTAERKRAAAGQTVLCLVCALVGGLVGGVGATAATAVEPRTTTIYEGGGRPPWSMWPRSTGRRSSPRRRSMPPLSAPPSVSPRRW